MENTEVPTERESIQLVLSKKIETRIQQSIEDVKTKEKLQEQTQIEHERQLKIAQEESKRKEQNEGEGNFARFSLVNENWRKIITEIKSEKEGFAQKSNELKNADDNRKKTEQNIETIFETEYKKATSNPEIVSVLEKADIRTLEQFKEYVKGDTEDDVNNELAIQQKKIDAINLDIKNSIAIFKKEYLGEEHVEEIDINKVLEILDEKNEEIKGKISENENQMIDIVYNNIIIETELNPAIKEEFSKLEKDINSFLNEFVVYADYKSRGIVGGNQDTREKNLKQSTISAAQIIARFETDFGHDFTKQAMGKVCDEQFNKIIKEGKLEITRDAIEQAKELIFIKIDSANINQEINKIAGDSKLELLSKEVAVNKSANELVNNIESLKNKGILVSNSKVELGTDRYDLYGAVYTQEYLKARQERQDLIDFREDQGKRLKELKELKPSGFPSRYVFEGKKFTKDEYNDLLKTTIDTLKQFEDNETNPVLKKYREMEVIDSSTKDTTEKITAFVNEHSDWGRGLLRDEGFNKVDKISIDVDIFIQNIKDNFALETEKKEKFDQIFELNKQKSENDNLFVNKIKSMTL